MRAGFERWSAVAAALAALAVLWAPPARAATLPRAPSGPRRKSDYQLAVSVGLAGHCRLGWVPVHVKIDAAREFDGQLVAVLRAMPRAPVLYEARRSLKLAAGSKTDYHLYLRHESPHMTQAQVQVYLQRGRRKLEDTLQPKTLRLVAQTEYLVCVVSARPGVLSALRLGSGGNRAPQENGQAIDANRNFVVAQPRLLALPDRAAGYNGVDFLMLHEAPFDQLGSARLTALKDFVRGGGLAVLSAGDRTWFLRRQTRLLVPILKAGAAPAGDAAKLRERLGRAYDGDGNKDVLKDSSIAVHQLRIPGFREDRARGFLVGRCGLGRALVWRLNPADPKLKAWPGLYNLFGRLGYDYRRKPRDEYGGGFAYGYGEGNNPVAAARAQAGTLNLARERSVSALLVVFLVVFYLVLVGPVNYFVLRRLDMRALSIVTIPLLAAVFVLLTFAVGYISRGVTTVGRRLTMAVAASGSGRARCLTYQGVFPAGSMLADVGTDGAGLITALAKTGLGGEQKRVFALQNEAGCLLENHPLRMWEMAHFQADSVRSLGGAVSLVAHAVPSGSGVREVGTFEVKNDSAVKLEEAFVVKSTGGGYYCWLGEVPPKGSRTGKLLRWQQEGERKQVYGSGQQLPALQLRNALVFWLRGGLGASTSYPQPGGEDSFAQQAAAIIYRDPRVLATQNHAKMLLFAKVGGEELEPVRLDGRPVRAKRGEAVNLLVVSAEQRFPK